MARFTLRARDAGVPYHKIMDGQKWVGRVLKHATAPYYLGIVGPLTVKASTATEAFDAVVAQHRGDTKNRRVRRPTQSFLASPIPNTPLDTLPLVQGLTPEFEQRRRQA